MGPEGPWVEPTLGMSPGALCCQDSVSLLHSLPLTLGRPLWPGAAPTCSWLPLTETPPAPSRVDRQVSFTQHFWKAPGIESSWQ